MKDTNSMINANYMEPLTKSRSYDGESDFTGTINAAVGLAWIAETFADFENDYWEDEQEKERKRNRNHFANGRRSFTVTKESIFTTRKNLKTKT